MKAELSHASNVEARRGSASEQADQALASLGYKAELPRNLSMLSVLGLSFAIIAAPFGISTTLYIVLYNGVSVTLLYGWVLVTLISLCIAASLAEICAVYPTAGGVYYWSAMLSTRKWAPLVSFVDGWLTLVGNWTVTLSINFGGAQLVLSAIEIFNPDYDPAAKPWHCIVALWVIMIICALVNAFGSRYLDLINKVCIYWTAASVIIIMVTMLVMAPSRHTGAFVFGHYDSSASGWTSGWSFFVGLLLPAYTLTGYGMVAAMCEEVQNPEREVPKAIVLSVAAAGITGLVYIVPLLFVLPDVQMLLKEQQPIGKIFHVVTGSAAGGFGLLFLILGILMFAGIGALTAASRCTYAFARDGAIPGYKLWSRVDKRLGMPLWALTLSTVVDCLLGLIYFGSSAAFNSFTGVATICLSMSYGVPVLVSLVRKRNMLQNSPFSLGKFGVPINIVCVVWIVFAIIIFCMPVAIPVDPSTMNYASVVFFGFAAIALAWYFIYARRNFHGPPVLREDFVAAVDESPESEKSS